MLESVYTAILIFTVLHGWLQLLKLAASEHEEMTDRDSKIEKWGARVLWSMSSSLSVLFLAKYNTHKSCNWYIHLKWWHLKKQCKFITKKKTDDVRIGVFLDLVFVYMFCASCGNTASSYVPSVGKQPPAPNKLCSLQGFALCRLPCDLSVVISLSSSYNQLETSFKCEKWQHVHHIHVTVAEVMISHNRAKSELPWLWGIRVRSQEFEWPFLE